MKNPVIVLVLVLLLGCAYSCDAKPSQASTTKSASKVKAEVYYFHYTRRCVTCNAVEEVTKKTLEALYSKQLKAGVITFKSINLDEATGNAIGEKLSISGQTLLIVGSGKSVDLTSEAFLTARSNPEKLKASLRSNIDTLIK
jgi:hypothetical protein